MMPVMASVIPELAHPGMITRTGSARRYLGGDACLSQRYSMWDVALRPCPSDRQLLVAVERVAAR